jgi:Cdc6-like AAA superfamily ATPase
MIPTDVLVLGASGTGKTHYAGQLLGRLRNDREGRLRLRPGGIDDLSKLEEVLLCLEEGRAAGHTNVSSKA